MENFKNSTLYKQTQLRNKVDKLNKAEVWALERKIKVIDKESNHFNAMIIREKKEIELKLKDIQKNSGRSIMGLKPSYRDKHIKESPLFNTGIILSEKQFQSWRLKEKYIQDKYKIKELERLQEMNRQRSLIQLLKDLHIISEKYENYKDEKDIDNTQNQSLIESNEKKFPLIYERIVKKNSLSLDIERPVTVDCSNIQREYIDMITKIIIPSKCDLLELDFLSDKSNYIETINLAKVRSKSAPPVKQSLNPDQSILIPLKSINKEIDTISKDPSFKKLSPQKKVAIIKPKKKTKENEKSLNESSEQFFIRGLSQMPKWQRQLLIEAPIGLNNSFSQAKIHAIISQTQKRRDLEKLIADNVADVEKLAKEKSEEQKRKVENMQATLREMDEMEIENQENSL